MALPHAQSGQIIDVNPLGSRLRSTVSTALFKAEDLEVIRLVLLAGKEMRPHRVSGVVEDVSFLGSIVRIRIRLGDDATTVSLDVFNDPNLMLPDIESPVTLSFPPEACLVIGEGPAPEVDAFAEV